MQAERSAFFLYPYRKESVFPLLSGKGLGLPAFCRKAALKGLAGQEKIILATLRYFFLPGLAQKGNPRGRRPIKSGNTSRWDYSFIKLRIMKLQIIESISKHAVTLVLVIGILMLTDKGIMPTGMIALLLLTGGIIGFLFRALLLIVRIIFVLFIVGLLFS